MSEHERFDVIVVGAGFAGLYMIHQAHLLGLTVRCYEAGDGVGGTWYWNRYPGCRCDVESLDYSYSFSPELEQEWEWTERYPPQEQVERYLNHVADRFDLRREVTCGARVTSAHFDDGESRWTVVTDTGEVVSAEFLVTAVGCLSRPNTPAIPGIERFAGRVLHTCTWPAAEVDFAGQRVGVIGTGSSGVQVIPLIAAQAEHLYVFQRTPHFVVPARNQPLEASAVSERKAGYAEHRAILRQGFFGFTLELGEGSALAASPDQREREYERRWQIGGPAIMGSYNDLIVDEAANATLADFFRRKLAETVRDPAVARALTPTGYPIGSKRLCQGTGYYETFNRPDVTLVDLLTTPFTKAGAAGLTTTAQTFELDAIVFATGFDAVTGALDAIDIRGRHGISLRDKWANGPRAYLGVASAGFPNLFMITGPGSPSVVSNVVLSIEQHVEWIGACIEHMRSSGVTQIEPLPDAEDEWVAHIGELAGATLFPHANSWYLGANIPGKPRVFLAYLGGVGPYRDRCYEVATNGYEGFALTESPGGTRGAAIAD